MARNFHEIPPMEVLRRYFRVDNQSRLQRWSPKNGWRLASRIRTGSNYFTVGFERKMFQAHRIIWALHHGRAPNGLIDHINGCPWDNRIENLREATAAQNRWNAKISTQTNKTGHDNVVETRDGYRALVSADYKRYYSPVFEDAELAGLAAQEMQHRYHGEFAYAKRGGAAR